MSLSELSLGVAFGGEGSSSELAMPTNSAAANQNGFVSPRHALYPLLETESSEKTVYPESSTPSRKFLNNVTSESSSLRRTQSDPDLRSRERGPYNHTHISYKPWQSQETSNSQSADLTNKTQSSCVSLLQEALRLILPPQPGALPDYLASSRRPAVAKSSPLPPRASSSSGLRDNAVSALDTFQTDLNDSPLSTPARSPSEMFQGHSPPSTMKFLQKELPSLRVPRCSDENQSTYFNNDHAIASSSAEVSEGNDSHKSAWCSAVEQNSRDVVVYSVTAEQAVSIEVNSRRSQPATTGDVKNAFAARQLEATELYYQEALQADPTHPLLLRNYAQFIVEGFGDLPRAELWYERALAANQNDGELAAQYGKLVWDLYKDQERAAQYFDHGLRASPDNGYVLAAYAHFLWKSGGH
ncbi:hypothetical protein CYMTET_24016 [Cymbomonas tetramitiformis]|uniref:Uncharacterized protein n=1 Tax=Cymbomonas tetramitiformis TaxID=36881 RepID=A0AAE0BZ38_9CHLO|nr:hypothetical protein CYMTET_45573 [Cymbomonas tetramitiformis]KAK3267425.1 hypothetical protein CYMTET_24016 [Cymbomonas tetramitiformis]